MGRTIKKIQNKRQKQNAKKAIEARKQTGKKKLTFKELTKEIAKNKNVKNPEAIAGAIRRDQRKKFGTKIVIKDGRKVVEPAN